MCSQQRKSSSSVMPQRPGVMGKVFYTLPAADFPLLRFSGNKSAFFFNFATKSCVRVVVYYFSVFVSFSIGCLTFSDALFSSSISDLCALGVY